MTYGEEVVRLATAAMKKNRLSITMVADWVGIARETLSEHFRKPWRISIDEAALLLDVTGAENILVFKTAPKRPGKAEAEEVTT